MSNKLYPQYQAEGKLPKESVKEINQKIKDLFTSKLGFTIVSSADTVVISAFLGLEALAIYQNYYYIINAVMGFVAIIYSSITAGVGNSKGYFYALQLRIQMKGSRTIQAREMD